MRKEDVQKQLDYFKKVTCKIVPDGTMTKSKMPNKYVEGVYPVYIDRAKGCTVWSGGESFVDYTCALGAILLGYADPAVNSAINTQLGNGTIYPLPNIKETRLAEALQKNFPCMEMMKFLKTGSEADNAAIRIARAVTGRDGIAVSGYGGWGDWYNAVTPHNAGTPKVIRKLIAKFEYNNIDSLKEVFSLSKDCTVPIGVVILEPYIYDIPRDNFLQKVIDFAHENGALVIFDEVVTGFRTKTKAAHTYFGVEPDLITMGKALGNGAPIAVVGGKKEYMKILEKNCFVSSTFGGDLIGIIAALEVLKILDEKPVIDNIWRAGEKFQKAFNEMTTDLRSHSVECIGLPPRALLKFSPTDRDPKPIEEQRKGLFWQECLKRGILMGYAHFYNNSHTEQVIDKTINIAGEAMKVVRKYWDEPTLALEGKCPVQTARLIATR